MNIVAVTACPTGIAHTYMAAEQLERTAKNLGHQIKVETQGSMGVDNEILPSEVDAADVVLFACDIDVEERERFEEKKILEVSVQKAIKDPEALFKQLQDLI
jgi:fructose-specific phosphotransferase system IIB component